MTPRKGIAVRPRYHSHLSARRTHTRAHIQIQNLYLIRTEMVATEDQLQRAKIPVAYRDYCSHLLIALNDCRLKEYWMPWKCEHERHSYEMCEYEEWKKRKAAKSKA